MGWPEYSYLTYVAIASAWAVRVAHKRQAWRWLAFRMATVALCLSLLTLGGFWK